MNVLKSLLILILILILTVLSQIGGVIAIIALYTFRWYDQRRPIHNYKIFYLTCYFLGLYIFVTFLIIPILAPFGGRVALPIFEKEGLRPHTFTTCLLNRHYVKPELRNTLLSISKKMEAEYPGTETLYLDANFPFLNKFPLIPHLSHFDGRKLDIAFCYRDRSGKSINDSPSWLGYGVCEAPRTDEYDAAKICDEKGYWQYSFLKKFVGENSVYEFDEVRTKRLVQLISEDENIHKIFLEPHLKTRMGLTSTKIRYHGCRAVRHDDHVHVEL